MLAKRAMQGRLYYTCIATYEVRAMAGITGSFQLQKKLANHFETLAFVFSQ